MDFLDRNIETEELRRVLNPDTPPRFAVVFGRRRLAKRDAPKPDCRTIS